MLIAKNKKAYFDYEILKDFEAGIMLNGSEIKSIRAKNVNLKGSYITEKGNEIWAKDLHISPYKFANDDSLDPLRSRKLLLNRKEIDYILGQLSHPGITSIPLELHLNKKGLAKLKIGVVRGKKKYDKRESIKRKDQNREIARRMKQY